MIKLLDAAELQMADGSQEKRELDSFGVDRNDQFFR